MGIPPLQPESDDEKVKATIDLIDYIFLFVVSYTCKLNRDDVISRPQERVKGNQGLTTNIKVSKHRMKHSILSANLNNTAFEKTYIC